MQANPLKTIGFTPATEGFYSYDFTVKWWFTVSSLCDFAKFFKDLCADLQRLTEVVRGIVQILLGYFWDTFGILLGYFWDTFGILLGYFWDTFGILLTVLSPFFRGYFSLRITLVFTRPSPPHTPTHSDLSSLFTLSCYSSITHLNSGAYSSAQLAPSLYSKQSLLSAS